jgi:hypothetical protein
MYGRADGLFSLHIEAKFQVPDFRVPESRNNTFFSRIFVPGTTETIETS